MKKIKRYDIEDTIDEPSNMEESKKGDYVLYEDIAGYFSQIGIRLKAIETKLSVFSKRWRTLGEREAEIRRENMNKPPYKYLLHYKAKRDPDIGYQYDVKYETSDSDAVGSKLVRALEEYGEIFEVKFSYIACPLCGRSKV